MSDDEKNDSNYTPGKYGVFFEERKKKEEKKKQGEKAQRPQYRSFWRPGGELLPLGRRNNWEEERRKKEKKEKKRKKKKRKSLNPIFA
jgi:hypothetical protein